MQDAGNMVPRVRASYYYDPVGLGAFNTRRPQNLANTNVYVAAGYTYTGMEYVQQPRTRVEIDLNVRVRGNDTFVGFDDLSGPVSVGELVEVYESESGVSGEGRVTEIDGDRELVYLSVDWPSLKEESASSGGEPWTVSTGEGWSYIVGEPSTVSVVSGWASAASEASALTTQLVFLGAVTSTITAQQESWMELVSRPCLAGIAGGNGAIWVTAPLYNSTGLLPSSLVEPFADIRQVNLNFLKVLGVAA